MRVSIINNNIIKSFLLPSKIAGNFWLSDVDPYGNRYNIINIEAFGDTWRLISNDDFICINNQKSIDKMTLQNYQFYTIKNRSTNKLIIVYCSPTFENIPQRFKIASNLVTGLVIGNDVNNDISYSSVYVEKNHAKMMIEDESVYIVDNDSKFGIYVNNIRVESKQKLELGDRIFIMGLKLVYVKVDSIDSLIINNPNGLVKTRLEVIKPKNINDNFNIEEEDLEVSLYEPDDYFHRQPRFLYDIEEYELRIDAPPQKQPEDDTPLILTIGPMITMGMTSIMMGYNTVTNTLSNGGSIGRAAPAIVMSVAMILGIFLWPSISKSYTKKRNIEKEVERQEKYGKYIEGKRKKIIEEIGNQSTILHSKYLTLDNCKNTILNKTSNLWERRTYDNDFLRVSLGLGNLPMKINIKYPEEEFTMEEDKMKEMVEKLGSDKKILQNVPVEFSYPLNYISAIVGPSKIYYRLMQNLIIQLMTYYSYDNLKIVVFSTKDKAHNWEFIKSLPHIWSNHNDIRYYATDSNEYNELCFNLDRVFAARKEKESGGFSSSETKSFDIHYLIITDSYTSIRNYDFISSILNEKEYLGFSVQILNEKITNLPDQCETFIKLEEDKGEIFTNTAGSENIEFKVDMQSSYDIEKCVKRLANMPIDITNDDEGKIPEKVGFLEMYDVGKVEQLNVLNRWEKNTPIMNMGVPIAVGKSGEKINLDLHEKYHGPHGLVAGMTGSGKSEFIITYILSMAINYHPDEIQFILIDYKGGGLAGAFENNSTGIKLPHLVGTITNLDANEIKRSLASVESELKRRQKLFNEAREISGESTIDIYKYQRLYRDGKVKEPISHLFIISDEFAELKNQQPEFMEQLIQTARIGRALGVHLILATQKPSGVVDPQIWSNTRFRVCFRVQDKGDSSEVIKAPDAALLKQTGRFYLQVGFNEIFAMGQAAWAGGKYYPSEKIKVSLDTSIEFVNNVGYTMHKVETKQKSDMKESKGEELANILKYIHDVAKNEKIKTRPLWLERISETIFVEALENKYQYKKQKYRLNPIVGEYDVPSMQEQYLLTVPFSKEGNAIVYGAAGSGKENFITTMIYSSMLQYSSKEVLYYIMDFGSETLKYFEDSPIVGDIMYINDDEKIKNLFKVINQRINERKKLFANFNGSYYDYCNNSGYSVPNIVVVLNNYEAFVDTYVDWEEDLVLLTRDCSKYGIYFFLAVNTPNGVRFKLKQNFAQTYVLQQNSLDDYSTILGNVYKTYPSKLFGRGIIKNGMGIVEFQTALAGPREEISTIIKDKVDELALTVSSKATNIPVLPQVVSYNNVKDEIGTTDELVIGIEKESLNISKYDFMKNYITNVASYDIETMRKFVSNLVKQMVMVSKSELIIVDSEEFLEETIDYMYYDKNFNTVFAKLDKIINDNYALYEKNNYNKLIFQNFKPITCVIIGLDNFINKLDSDSKNKLESVFTKAKEMEIIDFIFVDNVDKIKRYETESWYKATVNTNEGIWLGNGINDQYTIKVSKRTTETKLDIGNNFCFVVKKGVPVLVKYIEDLDN